MQLIRYSPQTDRHTTYWLREPYDAEGDSLLVHLGRLSDGYRYLIVPDGVTLPPQPDEVSVEPVTATAAVQKQLKAESPQLRRMADLERRGAYTRFAQRDIADMERMRDISGGLGGFVDEVKNRNAVQRSE